MPDLDPRVDALAAIPDRYADPDPSSLAQLPRGGTTLSYQGHADVTLSLIEIDPLWSWRPVGFTPDGDPLITKQGSRLIMWGYLTVHGKELPCVGTCGANQGDPEKELIGDLIRNGAMRFGVATRLWARSPGHADPGGRDEAGGFDDRRNRPQAGTGRAQRPRGSTGGPTPQNERQAPSQGSQVASRSEEEARIRASIDALDVTTRSQLRVDFRQAFGVTLSELPVERHREAAEWVSTWLDDTLGAADSAAATQNEHP